MMEEKKHGRIYWFTVWLAARIFPERFILWMKKKTEEWIIKLESKS
jgi:hypothetical protein